mgnify:CR=1 FL=1
MTKKIKFDIELEVDNDATGPALYDILDNTFDKMILGDIITSYEYILPQDL